MKNMMSIILVTLGLLCFVLLFKSVSFFDKI